MTGLAHLLLHASAFTLFVDLIVVLVLPFAHLADHFVLLDLGPCTGRPSFADHSRVQVRAHEEREGGAGGRPMSPGAESARSTRSLHRVRRPGLYDMLDSCMYVLPHSIVCAIVQELYLEWSTTARQCPRPSPE